MENTVCTKTQAVKGLKLLGRELPNAYVFNNKRTACRMIKWYLINSSTAHGVSKTLSKAGVPHDIRPQVNTNGMPDRRMNIIMYIPTDISISPILKKAKPKEKEVEEEVGPHICPRCHGEGVIDMPKKKKRKK